MSNMKEDCREKVDLREQERCEGKSFGNEATKKKNPKHSPAVKQEPWPLPQSTLEKQYFIQL